MKITIHRGTNQIGGCITEIQSAKGDKILIDFGHNLPEGDKPAQDKYDDDENVLKLLEGVSDVYYTHYHGDHISFDSEIYRAGVTQHIGALSLKMVKTLKRHMTKAEALKVSANNSLEALERFKTYTATVTETVGDIRITPYFVSHSAIDAHMFLIECDGITVLHTGDFRDHGYMGGGLMKNLKVNVVPKHVDVIITEGTMLARKDEKVLSEWDIQNETKSLMSQYKNAFVLCSSTDVDRFVSMFQATKHQRNRRDSDYPRWFVTDAYQGDQILNIKNNLNGIYSDIIFKVYNKDFLPNMVKNGFTMLVRNTKTFEKYLAEIVPHIDLNETVFIYSQFKGYIDPTHSAFKQSTYDFVHKYKWHLKELHTSGHASCKTLAEVCNLVNPSLAIIPIHKEADTDFASLPMSSELKKKIVTKSMILEKENGNFVNFEVKE